MRTKPIECTARQGSETKLRSKRIRNNFPELEGGSVIRAGFKVRRLNTAAPIAPSNMPRNRAAARRVRQNANLLVAFAHTHKLGEQ
ncbi:MAG: hypothetical protein JWP08_2216 [Bryobacterales bacterium]|nr:hypothetical protein [Bryobacterales bacterium]